MKLILYIKVSFRISKNRKINHNSQKKTINIFESVNYTSACNHGEQK